MTEKAKDSKTDVLDGGHEMKGVGGPPAFHLLVKPTGADCNLACRYCFYLPKKSLYPGSGFRMTDEMLEACMRQLIDAHKVNEITVGWQGGEPTLMGIDFFRRAVEYQKKYARPGMTIQNTIQTNGMNIDNDWGRFFSDHRFLVGLSLDGPAKMHDAFRKDRTGNPTHHRVMRGLDRLNRHCVEVNILTTVHAANVDDPLNVYRFLKNDAGAEFIQFIPIVEPERDGAGSDRGVSKHTVSSGKYGRFLIDIFDEWVRRDVGKVFVQLFDVALEKWVGAPPSLCAYAPTCGGAVVLEHNGDVYACDHFVNPRYFLGNIAEVPLKEIVASGKLRRFGLDKRDRLPSCCQECDVLFACNGECPKNRFIHTPDGERGLNYLCTGLKRFFLHVDESMRIMADLLRRGRAPAEIMNLMAERDFRQALSRAKRNDPCPCNSGKKFKHCHGRGQR
jgi:uncharacterized protein